MSFSVPSWDKPMDVNPKPIPPYAAPQTRWILSGALVGGLVLALTGGIACLTGYETAPAKTYDALSHAVNGTLTGSVLGALVGALTGWAVKKVRQRKGPPV